MPKKITKQDENKITFRIEKENIETRNEAYEKTLDNIHAMAVFTVKNYGRLGYQIKLMEQVLDELKKLNKDK